MNNHTRARVAATAAVILALRSAAASAQSGPDAAVIGTVHDTSGAALAGARLTISSSRLIGGAQTNLTDSQGAFRFVFLPAGDCEIVATRDGFTSVKRDVTLRPGLEFTVDFVLPVAGLTETISVEAPSPVLDVRASSSPVMIDRTAIDDIPLPRTPASGAGTVADLVNLAPGVVQSVALGGTFLSNQLTLDGTTGNDVVTGQPTLYPNANWIDEVQVVSSGADARYGGYSGAIVNAITRSGSNRVSGLADYWTTRPTWTGNNRGSLSPQLQNTFRPVTIDDRWDASGQVGGPITKDRLWFFTGVESYRDAYWPTTFAARAITAADPKIDGTDRKAIGKLTAALSASTRAEGFIEHAVDHVNGANAAPLITSDALQVFRRPETAWNARLLWTAGSKTVVEFRHSGHNFSYSYAPADGRQAGPPAHFDQLTQISSVNVPWVQDFHEQPLRFGAELTHYANGPSGAHDIRGGLEYEHTSHQRFSGLVDNEAFSDIGGQPSEVELWDGATYRPTQSQHTAFVQDQWSATDRLTVNAGLRFGRYRGSVPGHDDAFRSHSVSPRIGVAFDLASDHRTVVRVHYGRYEERFVTSYYDFLDPLSQTPDIVAAVVGPNQFVEEFRYPTGAQASIDPHTRFPFVEEYLAGVERQLPFAISLKAQVIARNFRSAIGFVDPAKIWLASPGVDPGPDGKRGTSDDGGPMVVYFDQNAALTAPLLTNPAAAHRRYRGAQVIATKRYARNLQFQGSYTWSRTVGNYNNNAYSNAAESDLGLGGAFSNPNGLINTDGRTPQDFTHDVKLLGTYRIAQWGGVNVSGFYKYQSGRPWARSAAGRGFGAATEVNQIFVEPRASRQLDAVCTLDMRIEKTWTPAKAARLGAFVDAFNVWNRGVALRASPVSGPSLGVPTQWLEPRTVRAGVRLMF